MTKDGDASKSDKKTSISHYFLRPGDKLGDKVVQVMLNGDNYDELSMKLCGALRARKKTGFIDGTIKKPSDTSKDCEDWYMVKAMIVNWIFNVIEPALGSMITYVDDARVLWEDIEQWFSVGNGPKLHRVKGSIKSCRQNEKEPVSEYYGRLKKLWDELDKYNRNPTCECRGCKCNIKGKLDKKRDEGKEPLPSLNRAYAAIVQEEGVHGVNTGSNSGSRGDSRSEPIGFVAKTANNVGFSSRSMDSDNDARPRCEKCNRWGHHKEKCFDIIGYPKGWKERSRQGYGGGGGGGRGRGNGAGCGGANHAQGSDESTENKEQFVSVPKEQWDAYVNNAKANNASASSSRMSGKNDNDVLWLLVSGATHHMTGSRHLLKDVCKIKSCPVTLPNGKSSQALEEGKVELGGKIVLNSVLFVPEFKCNLISDRASKTKIGTLEQRGRLYLLRGSTARAYGSQKRGDELLKNFVAMVRRQFSTDVKVIRTDNGTEFTCLKSFFAEQGIMHQTTCVGTSQQNGRVERKHRHILNVARALRFESGLPHSRRDGDKFASRSHRCVFVGYPFGKKGWEVYDIESKEFFVSRDVVFDETEFPFRASDSLLSRNIGENDVVYDDVVYDEEILLGDEPDVGRPSGDESMTQGGVPGGDVNETTQEPENGSGDAGPSHGGADEVKGELGRGKRPYVPWSRYDESEYVTGAARVVEPVEGHDRSF
ncbi:uncharacterized protein LOC141617945 [Silene latifolia]|uniref:uncharacterized protein LOC141617945 n=1 Tax=Silene latifolia TaxID=37657 RepID=UPI003D783ACE